MESAESSLRARKKLATREALIEAATRLALERGPENVKVEDIAAGAGVSPRTYNNYFSSREEAICALRAERGRRVAEALRARPAGESLAEAVVAAMVEPLLEHQPDPEMIQLVANSPALQGQFLKTVAAVEVPLAEAIAERAGLDAHTDLRPWVLAAALCSASRMASGHWLRQGCVESPLSVLLAALHQVAALADDLETTQTATDRTAS